MTQDNRPQLTRELLALAWPAAIQGLVTTVILFTDRLLLGRYSTEAISSMGISGPLLWSVFSVFTAYSAGVIAVIGRAVGAGQIARVRATLPRVLILGLVLGLAVGVVGFFTRDLLADLLAGGVDTTEGVREAASVYLGIVFCVAPLAFVATTGSTALQAGGDTRTPMWIAAIAGAINLIVSSVLIYGLFGLPELGVEGAAIGTSAAITIQAVLLLVILATGRGPVALRRHIDKAQAALDTVLRVAAPAFGERIIYHAAYMVFTGFIGHLGDVSLAANQALMAIESISFIAADSVGIAAGALVAIKLGAGRPEEAERVGWLAARWGAIVLSGAGLVFLIIPELCVGIFTDDPAVIEEGARCLRIAAIAQPLMAITDALAGSLRGAGDTKTPMIAALIGPIGVRLTLCWLLAYPMGLGLMGIWIGSTLDWVVRAAWLGAAFKRGRWKDALEHTAD